MRWLRFFKRNTRVAATSFSHEESGRPRRVFTYSPLTTPLSHYLSKTCQILHNSASQYTLHLNTVNNSAMIHVIVGQNKKSTWCLKDYTKHVKALSSLIFGTKVFLISPTSNTLKSHKALGFNHLHLSHKGDAI